jgi:hypothetical protein
MSNHNEQAVCTDPKSDSQQQPNFLINKPSKMKPDHACSSSCSDRNKNDTTTNLAIVKPSPGNTTGSTFARRVRSSVCVVRLALGSTTGHSSRFLLQRFLSL